MAIMSVLSKQSRRGGRGLRRDCLDHVIAINESQLRRVIRSYVDYYHADRTHLGLEKDAPDQRPIEPRKMGEVVTISRVGGLSPSLYARTSESCIGWIWINDDGQSLIDRVWEGKAQ